MSGETGEVPSGWTLDALHVHLDRCISYERQIADERDRRYEERWAAQESATEYAQKIANEFRGALSDLSEGMATKDQLTALTAQVIEQRSRLDVGNPAVALLQNQAAHATGFTDGSHITMGKIYAAIGALGVFIATIILVATTIAR